MAGEILELTPLAYTQKLASLFPDKPFEGIIEALASIGFPSSKTRSLQHRRKQVYGKALQSSNPPHRTAR